MTHGYYFFDKFYISLTMITWNKTKNSKVTLYNVSIYNGSLALGGLNSSIGTPSPSVLINKNDNCLKLVLLVLKTNIMYH